MKIYCILLCLIGHLPMTAQYKLAALEGEKSIDTRGWILVGNARATDTRGDNDSYPNELLLCENRQSSFGACFFDKKLDLTIYDEWYVEFDFRIYEGSKADGIAFFFLENPPTQHIHGGGLGLPAKPKGLIVGYDTFDNEDNAYSPCCTPKLEIRYADGTQDYREAPLTVQPTLSNLRILRSNNYVSSKISYKKGEVRVYIDNKLMLQGYYKINYAGYLGFSASTGLYNDLHSIRNVRIYTYKPVTEKPKEKPKNNPNSVELKLYDPKVEQQAEHERKPIFT